MILPQASLAQKSETHGFGTLHILDVGSELRRTVAGFVVDAFMIDKVQSHLYRTVPHDFRRAIPLFSLE
jgi:hypothetical protein